MDYIADGIMISQDQPVKANGNDLNRMKAYAKGLEDMNRKNRLTAYAQVTNNKKED